MRSLSLAVLGVLVSSCGTDPREAESCTYSVMSDAVCVNDGGALMARHDVELGTGCGQWSQGELHADALACTSGETGEIVGSITLDDAACGPSCVERADGDRAWLVHVTGDQAADKLSTAYAAALIVQESCGIMLSAYPPGACAAAR